MNGNRLAVELRQLLDDLRKAKDADFSLGLMCVRIKHLCELLNDDELNREALVELVRQAMGAGVACFTDRVRDGLVDMQTPLTDAFGDFPAEFLRIRTDLVDALTEDTDR